jgi:hypothetical protein
VARRDAVHDAEPEVPAFVERLAREEGAKMRGRSLASMPRPVSATSRSEQGPGRGDGDMPGGGAEGVSSRTRIVILLPAGVASTEFEMSPRRIAFRPGGLISASLPVSANSQITSRSGTGMRSTGSSRTISPSCRPP